MRGDNLYQLPPDLPVPEDDGAARHLPGLAVPPVSLPSTAGGFVRLNEVRGLTVVYVYPRTGRPNEDAPGGTEQWNRIPGARGCTPQSCAYRDHHHELQAVGATVYGLSAQTTEYQQEAVARLQLPFPLLSDAAGELSAALRLPSFRVEGVRLLKRLTLIIRGGKIVHCIYPVFPPDRDPETVIEWLDQRGHETKGSDVKQ